MRFCPVSTHRPPKYQYLPDKIILLGQSSMRLLGASPRWDIRQFGQWVDWASPISLFAKFVYRLSRDWPIHYGPFGQSHNWALNGASPLCPICALGPAVQSSIGRLANRPDGHIAQLGFAQPGLRPFGQMPYLSSWPYVHRAISPSGHRTFGPIGLCGLRPVGHWSIRSFGLPGIWPFGLCAHRSIGQLDVGAFAPLVQLSIDLRADTSVRWPRRADFVLEVSFMISMIGPILVVTHY